MADDHHIDIVAANESEGMASDSEQDYPSRGTTPPTLEEFERWQAHIGLQKFGEGLNAAAKAIFPNDGRSRYSKGYVLMLTWEDVASRSPESEVTKLSNVFKDVYRFEVENWIIPSEASNSATNQKISDFINLGGNSDDDLKIVYYAGQTRLIKNRELAWTRFVELFPAPTLYR